MSTFRNNRISNFIRRHYRSFLPFLTLGKVINITSCLAEMKLGKVQCRSRPFVLRVDPCTACNLRCPTCACHSFPIKEKRMLDLDDFKKVVDKVKKFCVRISLYDTGEPLVNKNIYKMIRYANDNRLSTLISTNFTLFRASRHLRDLFDSRLTVLSISIDGITQETYSKYRVRGNVEDVKTAMESVVRHKRETRSKWPTVEAQVIDLDHLADEKESIYNYLEGVGVDQITWKEEMWGINSSETSEKHRVEKKINKCFWLYCGAVIRPDGNFYPCCDPCRVMDYERFPFGNIFDQDIDEIWNNKYYQYSRSLFTKGPDLEYNEEMADIPCNACNLFKKERKMLALGETATSDQQTETLKH